MQGARLYSLRIRDKSFAAAAISDTVDALAVAPAGRTSRRRTRKTLRELISRFIVRHYCSPRRKTRPSSRFAHRARRDDSQDAGYESEVANGDLAHRA